jgi:hypothetical protein
MDARIASSPGPTSNSSRSSKSRTRRDGDRSRGRSIPPTLPAAPVSTIVCVGATWLLRRLPKFGRRRSEANMLDLAWVTALLHRTGFYQQRWLWPSVLNRRFARNIRQGSRGSRLRSCARRVGAVLLPGGDPGADGGFELLGRAVHSPAQPLLGELGEPPLDEVEPRAVRRREVQREAGTTEQPAVISGCCASRS